jgi:hypothetical protein
MNEIYNATYTLKDRGVSYPNQNKEVTVKKGETVKAALQSQLNKYRRAMNLTPKFEVEVIASQLVGYGK